MSISLVMSIILDKTGKYGIQYKKTAKAPFLWLIVLASFTRGNKMPTKEKVKNVVGEKTSQN